MRSDLERFRTAAKRLKKAFVAGEADAARRLEAVLPDATTPKHADFLHVIARESGHESWPKLKFALEAAAMSRAERAERLKIALYFGQRWVVRKLLEEDPTLPAADLGVRIATYNVDTVGAILETSPEAATLPIGVRTPILHLAYSQYIHMAPERKDAMLRLAALLVEHGADVNDGYPWEPGSDHRISALYGALGHANNLALAEWLLEHGAKPDDQESLYHATELGHHDGLKLLMRFDVTTPGTNALPRALDFDDEEAVRLLLEHGADPNEAVAGHPSGEPIDSVPALHQAARRWCSVRIGRLLLEHGANPTAVWRRHTTYATARIYGNDAMACLLSEQGHATPLSTAEEVLADCAVGKAPATRLRLADLQDEDRHLLSEIAAGPIPLAHLKALIDAGLDPNEADAMGMTALHIAGWEGLPERVAFLLTLGPNLAYRNAYGGDALGTVIHGAEFCPKAGERDHIACARLLLEAGAVLHQDDVSGCGNEAMVLFLESWAGDHALGD